jgi:hypothetical protein
MSPFKSSKLSLTSISSKYLLKRKSTAGVAVTSTSFETWSSGNYSYIAFRSPGQFTVNRSGKIDICVVGGGGGGGQGNAPPTSPTSYGAAAGGGAGGLLQQYDLTFGEGTYVVTIGGGGAGGTRPSVSGRGTNGSPSSIVSPGTGIALTAFGGGGGAGWGFFTGQTGASGGGGFGGDIGGSGNIIAAPPSVAIPAPLQPQGYPGGTASTDPSGIGAGGGGGGAAEAGLSAGSIYGGIGGAGERIFSGDVGITTTYGTAAPAPYAPGRYVAGGGGGGNTNFPYGNLNVGGVGGGGPGGFYGPTIILQGSAATIYTGGGGGGGYRDPSGAGGAGAPGLVIIRYRTILDD